VATLFQNSFLNYGSNLVFTNTKCGIYKLLRVVRSITNSPTFASVKQPILLSILHSTGIPAPEHRLKLDRDCLGWRIVRSDKVKLARGAVFHVDKQLALK